MRLMSARAFGVKRPSPKSSAKPTVVVMRSFDGILISNDELLTG